MYSGPVPSCFAVLPRSLRRLTQLRLHVAQRRRQRAAVAKIRPRRPGWHGGPRHKVCMEDRCLKRARREVDGRALCRGHTAWHSKYVLLRAHFSSTTYPPRCDSPLGRWVAKQRARLTPDGGAAPLSTQQHTHLRSIPSWILTRREFRKEHQRERAQELLELETMYRHDMDAADAEHCVNVLRHDGEILRLSRLDARSSRIPCTRIVVPQRSTRDARSGQLVPLLWDVPLPLGVLFQGMANLPSDFHRLDDAAAIDALFAKRADLGLVRVAYSVAASSKCGHLGERTPWRALTFEDFACTYPAQSITLLYYTQMYPGSLVGQQAAYAAYLVGIEFVGGIWMPDSHVRPHWGTHVDRGRIRFDSACRIPGGHMGACKRHSVCICGLTDVEARAAMREARATCCTPAGVHVQCACTPTHDEAMGWLFLDATLCSFDLCRVIHAATAIGFVPHAEETLREGRGRARLLLCFTIAVAKWYPFADNTAAKFMYPLEDDIVQKYIKFAASQGTQKADTESLRDFMTRAQSNLKPLQGKLATDRVRDLGVIDKELVCRLYAPACSPCKWHGPDVERYTDPWP